jgi:opacity protein-like surface antigen
MKKLMAILLCVFVSTSAWAVPLRSGLYLGFKGGGAYAKPEIPWATNEPNAKEDNKKISFMMGIAGGLRVRHFRVEVEYISMLKTTASGGYEQELDTFMAQGYFDFPFKSPLRPYLNLGLGVYEAEFKRKGEWSDKAHAFTWGGGGGLTLAISTATNLDLGYRYLDIGKFKTKDGSVEQDNHLFYLGWRHVF